MKKSKNIHDATRREQAIVSFVYGQKAKLEAFFVKSGKEKRREMTP